VATEPPLVTFFYQFCIQRKQNHDSSCFFPYSLSTMARRMRQIMDALKVPLGLFTLSGPRPGGATIEYLHGLPIANLKFRGRWAAEGSLEHYIQECVAYSDFESLPDFTNSCVRLFCQFFPTLVAVRIG